MAKLNDVNRDSASLNVTFLFVITLPFPFLVLRFSSQCRHTLDSSSRRVIESCFDHYHVGSGEGLLRCVDPITRRIEQ